MFRITYPNGTFIETDNAGELEQLVEAERLSQVYTVATLAKRLDIGQSAAYDLIREGRIHYTCLGAKNYRVTEADVRALLAKPAPYPTRRKAAA